MKITTIKQVQLLEDSLTVSNDSFSDLVLRDVRENA